MNDQHIDELIAKYLAGEALPDEAMFIDDWKAQSTENLTYFNQSKNAFQFFADEGYNSERLFAKITAQTKPKSRIVILRNFSTPYRIAASLLLISILGFMAYFIFQSVNIPADEMIAANKEAVTQQLKDGTNVVLTKNAKLTVVGGFDKKHRKLKLEGEAFFDVIHNDEKPFIIEAGGIIIEDIGTKFTIKANPQSDTIEVFVTEGIVEITTNKEQLKLEANQGALFVKSTQTLEIITELLQDVTRNKMQQFSFNAQQLGTVISLINKVHEEQIVLSNTKLANCLITVSFNGESIETIANVIAETLNITVEKINKTYVLKGTACSQ